MRSQSLVVKGLIAVIFAASFLGCSTKNDNVPSFDAATGKHPAGWVVPLTGGNHPGAFFANSTQCVECHGNITDPQGGNSRVSCASASFSGISCHAGGPTHIAGWVDPLTGGNHPQAFLANPAQCANCHGNISDPLGQGGTSRVSCFSASFAGITCHVAGPSSGHPTGWRDPALHGAAAKSQPGPKTGFSSCQPCHGADFTGGVSKVSCFSSSTATGSCHGVNAPHAPAPWLTNPSPTHTSTVDDAAGLNAAVCALCHTTGNPGKPSCFSNTLCHGVPAGGAGHPLPYAQPKLHGFAAMANLSFCQQCHANNPSGGPGSNPRFNVPHGRLVNGCEDCHAPLAAHPRVLQIPAVFGTITTLNSIGTPWYLHCKANPSGFDACTHCHGAALDGVGAVTGATACTFCHRIALPTTVKNCQSCHVNPPSGTVYPNVAAAHLPSALAVQSHSTLNVADVCGECHLGLGSVTLDHFLRARNHTASVQPGPVVFGAFTHNGGLTPVYTDATKQCTNTYCHGATLVGGTNKSPIWSSTTYLTAAGCGTCHGFPPANAAHTGFTSATLCNGCHTHVNGTNNGFTDPTKHVNGAIDVSQGVAHAFPYPGSVHMSAAASPFTSCLACHSNNVANRGGYPVTPLPTPPNPPDCQGCHVKAGPGNSCGSCHGTAANGGRPNGSSFPDVAGQHSNNHGSFGCSTCHGTNGTGQTTHGPSNGTAHADANVIIQFTGSATGVVYTRSGLGNGHGTCTGTCSGQGHSSRTW